MGLFWLKVRQRKGSIVTEKNAVDDAMSPAPPLNAKDISARFVLALGGIDGLIHYGKCSCGS